MSELCPVGDHPGAPTGDIVFVHGLGGHWRQTWMADPRNNETFWPLWLARDLPFCRTWSLDYDADLTRWGGSVMDIETNADTILEILKVRGLGQRPIVFLVHSLGGLVTKALLRSALASKKQEYRRIAEQTRGIVLFATPNSGARLASFAASWLWFLGPSPVLKDMRAHGSALRKLNTWYRDQVTDGALGGRDGVQVFYEMRRIRGVPFLIVDETSADPGIPDVKPLALAADHWEICKLRKTDEWLYLSVSDFVKQINKSIFATASVSNALYAESDAIASELVRRGLSAKTQEDFRKVRARFLSLRPTLPASEKVISAQFFFEENKKPEIYYSLEPKKSREYSFTSSLTSMLSSMILTLLFVIILVVILNFLSN